MWGAMQGFNGPDVAPILLDKLQSSSIPRVLRGLIERDRKLLGLLSQTAYAAILKTFQAFFDRPDVRPGCVISLQTFGGYG